MNHCKSFLFVLLFALFGHAPLFAGEPAAPVDVNHATLKQLASLTGIGKVRAEAIIAYRQEHPPFRRPEDLLNVRGIGRVVIEHNRDRLRFFLDDEEEEADVIADGG